MPATKLAIHDDSAPLRIDLGDQIRVGSTRGTLQTVLGGFQDGLSAAEIVARYPATSLADVYATIAYYLRNREEVDAYLKEVADEEYRILADAAVQEEREGFWKRLRERRGEAGEA